MWTQTDDLSLIENLCISSMYKDDVLMYFKVTPISGYKIYAQDCENLIGEVDLPRGYDFAINQNGYVAVDESFIIPDVIPDIEISAEEALEIITEGS